MHLTIVIPAFNEEKLLPATLAAVASAADALASRGVTHDVVVCDNNSTDGTADAARAGGARVAFESRNQISRARNAGAALARGDWLLFLDADCQPSAALFTDLAAALHNERVLYGGCRLVFDEPAPAAQIFLDLWHVLAEFNGWAAGSFLFVRREAFVIAGGFSTELFASEEIELSRRLKRLARRRGQSFVFLTAHPLVTSARKFHTHGMAQHLRFLTRTVLSGGRNLRRRESLPLWYDGKR